MQSLQQSPNVKLSNVHEIKNIIAALHWHWSKRWWVVTAVIGTVQLQVIWPSEKMPSHHGRHLPSFIAWSTVVTFTKRCVTSLFLMTYMGASQQFPPKIHHHYPQHNKIISGSGSSVCLLADVVLQAGVRLFWPPIVATNVSKQLS